MSLSLSVEISTAVGVCRARGWHAAKWSVKVFTERVGVRDRTIRYWVRNENLLSDSERHHFSEILSHSSSAKHFGTMGAECRLRAFGDAKISEYPEVRGVKLPWPGRDYDRAFGIVQAAAPHLLKLGRAEEHLSKGRKAQEKLRVCGFSLMRIEEFVNL